MRLRASEQRINSLALIITTSLLFVLFASAVMVGGHAAIGPLFLHRMHPTPDVNGTGDILYAMPDGMFCRHLTFDNTTGDISEVGIVPCSPDIDGVDAVRTSRFEWDGSADRAH